jgi:Uma2 family endonuclease
MSRPEPTVPASAGDEYRYGYRDIPRTLPDGTTTWERVALTLEDLLHPETDDHPMLSTAHVRDCVHLYNTARLRFAGIVGLLVLSDTGIYWDIAELRHHAPDLALIFGVRDPERNRPTFDVAAEGVRPALLLEVVSPSWRNNDVVTKVAHYHLARVPYYVIVDRETENCLPRLIGYRWAPQAWQEIPLDDQGQLRITVEGVTLVLGTVDDRVAVYDAETALELGDYAQVCAQLDVAEARLLESAKAQHAAEEQARAAAEERDTERRAREAAEQREREAVAQAAALQEQLRQMQEQMRQLLPPTPPPTVNITP